MIHTSTGRSLTLDELAQPDEIKSRVDFDKSIELKLGVRALREDAASMKSRLQCLNAKGGRHRLRGKACAVC
jgi:hypothetical protein